MSRITSHHLVDLLWSVLRRAWWGGLLAVHLHPLVSTLRNLLLEELTVGRGLAVGGLLLLATFFVLKIIDVRFLRLHTRHEALIAFWIITALVHSNAAAGAIEVAAIAPAPAAVLVSGSLAAASLLNSRQNRYRVRKLFSVLIQKLAGRRTRQVLQRCCQDLILVYQKYFQATSAAHAAPRGPPPLAVRA